MDVTRPARRAIALAACGLSAVLVALVASPASAGSAIAIDRSKRLPAAERAVIDAGAQAFLAASIDRTPGLWVAVWDPKRGYYEQAYGDAVAGSTPAVTADHFLIGSITKTVFATAVLEQVAQGTLSLTDTVRKLDPALARKYPAAAKATVAQLLGMRTQIPDYADAAVMQQFANPQQHHTRDSLIALGLAQGKPLPPVGGYSTTNYLLLGKVMQHVTGRTPESLVNAVFTQARMRQSRLPSGNVRMPAPAAHGYVGAVATSQAKEVNPSLTEDTDVSTWTMEWGKEGGGAYSTISNLATWGSTCLGDALLPDRLVKKRLQTAAINAGDYGLGIIKDGPWLEHSGQALGHEAKVGCNPSTGQVYAYALNSTYGTVDLGSYLDLPAILGSPAAG